MQTYQADMPMIERVREHCFATTAPDGVLDFYASALALGVTDAEAERMDSTLTLRVMRSRGAL